MSYARHRHLEFSGQYEAVLTDEMMNDHPIYTIRALGIDLKIDGKDEVRTMYRNWAETNQCVFYIEDEQVAVADNFVASTLTSYQQIWGGTLLASKVLGILPKGLSQELFLKMLDFKGIKAERERTCICTRATSSGSGHTMTAADSCARTSSSPTEHLRDHQARSDGRADRGEGEQRCSIHSSSRSRRSTSSARQEIPRDLANRTDRRRASHSDVIGDNRMRPAIVAISISSLALVTSCNWLNDHTPDLVSCAEEISEGVRPIAETRADRFHGKVQANTAKCRGGSNAVAFREVPWTDWGNYWATRDNASKSFFAHEEPARRQRLAHRPRVRARRVDQVQPVRQQWHLSTVREWRRRDRWRRGQDVAGDAAAGHAIPRYAAVGGAAAEQHCTGELIRHRTLNGICNDTRNPLMGSSRHALRPQREFRDDVPRQGARRAGSQSPRRTSRAALARSAGHQPQALHARADRQRGVQRWLRQARLREGRQLRLQEGAVLQRARRILDPVHDPRLVLAPRGGAQRAAVHGGRVARPNGSTASTRRSRPTRSRSSAAGPAIRSTAPSSPTRRRRRSSRTAVAST